MSELLLMWMCDCYHAMLVGVVSCGTHSIVRYRVFFFLMIGRPPRSTQSRSSAASDVYKRQGPIVIIKPEGSFYSQVKPEDVKTIVEEHLIKGRVCLLYPSPSPRDRTRPRMPSSA